jgi:hypothetical protein
MLVSLGLVMTVVGCGSASAPRQEAPILLVIESDGSRDGFIRTDGLVKVSGNGPAVGDLDDARVGLALRMFYSFPLHEIPDGAEITSVTLLVFQEGTLGQPFASLGELLVDHVNPGNALDPADYDGNSLSTDVGSLSRDFQQRYTNLDVGTSVSRDLVEGRARSWFRLRFPRDSNRDGNDDLLMLNDGENSRGSHNRPKLEVIYLRP